jgi:hypothetical protein
MAPVLRFLVSLEFHAEMEIQIATARQLRKAVQSICPLRTVSQPFPEKPVLPIGTADPAPRPFLRNCWFLRGRRGQNR